MFAVGNTREISVNWGKHVFTNYLYTCPYCKKESNSVEGFIKVSMGSNIMQCPNCYKFVKGE